MNQEMTIDKEKSNTCQLCLDVISRKKIRFLSKILISQYQVQRYVSI